MKFLLPWLLLVCWLNAESQNVWKIKKESWLDIETEPSNFKELKIEIKGTESSIRIEYLNGLLSLYDEKQKTISDSKKIIYKEASVIEEEHASLLLKFRATEQLLYFGDHCIARWNEIPHFPLEVKVEGLPIRDAYVQKFSNWEFADDFMVPEGEDDELPAWEILQGEWKVHTVLEDMKEQKSSHRLEVKVPEAQFSSNFYSLKGKGENALIMAGYPFYDRYEFSAAVKLEQKGESGLAFHVVDEEEYYAAVFEYQREGYYRIRLFRQKGESRQVLKTLFMKEQGFPWVRVRIQAGDQGAKIYCDDALVIDWNVKLGRGGAFGLFVHAKDPMRFDDVRSRSIAIVSPQNERELRYFSSLGENLITGRDIFLKPNQGWVFKSLRQGSHRLKVKINFEEQPVFSVLAGSSKDRERIEFVKKGKFWEFTHIEEDSQKQIAHGQVLFSGIKEKSIEMECYRIKENEIKIYIDGKLAYINHKIRASAVSGLYSSQSIRISEVQWLDYPKVEYKTYYEKNARFTNDPFMKHWSSPAGEWIVNKREEAWYKGDIMQRVEVELPFVAGGNIHLGAREGKQVGDLVLSLSTNAIHVLDASLNKLSELVIPNQNDSKLRVEIEDQWMSLSQSGNTILQKTLPVEIQGRRLFLEGYPRSKLADSKVIRYQLMDYPFTKAPTDWRTQGGKWQVINRFACDPRWSHLNGESKEGPTGIWSKRKFSGDFCIEIYAGMRHGWYERVGDMNITAMNKRNTPSEGYTITTTGWDFNHSQLFTRFYKEGQQIKQSDQYLLPRFREGNHRKWRNPLLSGGRSVHGAWYYLKMRRVGNKLEYFFDNEKVFEEVVEDKDLFKGGIGFWTYRNSIVLAKIRIAAEQIEVQPRELRAELPKVKEESIIDSNILVHSSKHSMNRDQWNSDSNHGPEISWTNNDEEPVVNAKAKIAGGKMRLGFKGSLFSLKDLAGFSFKYRSSSKGQANFHYSIGSVDEKGQFTPEERRFVQLTGTSFSNAIFKKVETTAIPEMTMGNCVLAINSGGPSMTQDIEGLEKLPFMKDSFFSGGNIYQYRGEQIKGLSTERTERYGDFTYQLPLKKGKYLLQLNFTEIYWQRPEQRLFQIWLQNSLVLDGIDIVKEKGPFKQYVFKTWVDVEDKGLRIELKTLIDNSKLSSIIVWSEKESKRDPSDHISHTGSDIQSKSWLHALHWVMEPKGEENHKWLRLEGFGNLQPSYVAQGLHGNGPGESFQIKDFTPVYLGKPELKLPSQIEFKLAALSEFVHPKAFVEKGQGLVGLNTLWFREQGQKNWRAVRWLNEDQWPNVELIWDRYGEGRLLSNNKMPLRNFLGGEIEVNGVSAPLEVLSPVEFKFTLPPRKPIARSGTNQRVVLRLGGFGLTLIDPPEEPLEEGPRLLDLKGSFRILTHMEKRNPSESILGLNWEEKRFSMLQDAKKGISYLRVKNAGGANRLKWSFNFPYIDLSSHPLLSFQYRGETMSKMSIDMGWSRAGFSETRSKSKKVRPMLEPQLNQSWHHWLGFLPDAYTSGDFEFNRYEVEQLTLGSLAKIDQSGRNSKMDFGDFIIGPAVSKVEDLKLDPIYFSSLGLSQVKVAMRLGYSSFMDLTQEQKEQLEWKALENATVPFSGVDRGRQGFHTLYLKAIDEKGRSSEVTNLPFIFDNHSPKPVVQLKQSDRIESNGYLFNVKVDHGEGAPLDLKSLRVYWNDRPKRLKYIEHAPRRQVEEFNINFSKLFRKELNTLPLSGNAQVKVKGFRDGAGNEGQDVEFLLEPSEVNDLSGPTWLDQQWSEHEIFRSEWLTQQSKNPFKLHRLHSLKINRKLNQEPEIVVDMNRGESRLTLETSKHIQDWKIQDAPFVSFQIFLHKKTKAKDLSLSFKLDADKKQSWKSQIKNDNFRLIRNDKLVREDLTAGHWHCFNIDMSQIIPGTDPGRFQKIKPESLSVGFDYKKNHTQIKIKDFILYSTPKSQMKGPEAFDMSGVSNYKAYWYNDDNIENIFTSSDSGVITLPSNRGTQDWLKVMSTDRRDNKSIPRWIPIPGGNTH